MEQLRNENLSCSFYLQRQGQKGLWKEQVAIYLLFPISQQKKVVSQHWIQI